jgi:predicted GH43/DUF377 family glycosyl hydrolase
MTVAVWPALVAALLTTGLFLYGLIGVLRSKNARRARRAICKPFLRLAKGPLLSPGFFSWNSEAVFNPAAWHDGERVHLLYRAIGGDGVSRLGYASSKDGSFFDERIPYPVFSLAKPLPLSARHSYDPILYPSGGSWGGVEDPRMTEIEGRVYVTMNAFDSWDCIRVAATSIDTTDLKRKRFRFSRPLFLSPAGEVHKNWVLFPEKIGGKFALLHSITPEIQIAYVDRLEDLDSGKERVASTYKPDTNRDAWDNIVRGVGPPPIKTAEGWLVFYHAMDRHDPNRYKVGALLLDLANPSILRRRLSSPVLEPDTSYENEGKPGVVYACGAVSKDSNLFLYYGGGDRVVCGAKTDFVNFVNTLMHPHHRVSV